MNMILNKKSSNTSTSFMKINYAGPSVLHIIFFSAGNSFLIFSKLLGMMSTQRNESVNALVKRKIRSYRRTNFITIVNIIRETIDDNYFQVFYFSFSSILNYLEFSIKHQTRNFYKK